MSQCPTDRRNRERPASCAAIDRRQEKAQKSAPQRLLKRPRRDPTRGARLIPRRREPLPGVPARPPER
jgi:hypothetical protein